MAGRVGKSTFLPAWTGAGAHALRPESWNGRSRGAIDSRFGHPDRSAGADRRIVIGFLLGGSLALIISRLIATQFHGASGIDVLAFGQSSALLDLGDAPGERRSGPARGARRSGREPEGRLADGWAIRQVGNVARRSALHFVDVI